MAELDKKWLINKNELSRLTGFQVETIAQWERRGCPVHQKGRKGLETLFFVPDVWKWREADRIRPEVSKFKGAACDQNSILNRKLIAEAELKELELEKMRGTMLNRKVVSKAWDDLLVTFRQRLTGLPKKMSHEVDDREERIRLEGLWERDIRAALEVLSTFEPPDRSPADEADSPTEPAADQATAEADGERVGRAASVRQQRRERQRRPVAK